MDWLFLWHRPSPCGKQSLCLCLPHRLGQRHKKLAFKKFAIGICGKPDVKLWKRGPPNFLEHGSTFVHTEDSEDEHSWGRDVIEPSLQVLMLLMPPSACKCIYVGEEKRAQEGKNKAPVTIRTMLLMLLLSLISSMLLMLLAVHRRRKMCPGGKEQGTSDNVNNATDASSFQAGAQFQFSGGCICLVFRGREKLIWTTLPRVSPVILPHYRVSQFPPLSRIVHPGIFNPMKISIWLTNRLLSASSSECEL